MMTTYYSQFHLNQLKYIIALQLEQSQIYTNILKIQNFGNIMYPLIAPYCKILNVHVMHG
jgi:hypothetical protein